MHHTVLFTIATNGYGEIFADHLESQRNYAHEHDYAYLAVTKTPPFGISATNSAWLKLFLIRRLLRTGVQRVMFLDSDAMVIGNPPALESMEVSGKSIYMSRESNGNYNSGVIFCLLADGSLRFLNHLCRMADWPSIMLPAADRNLYENGHVIYASRQFADHIETISPQWNYNYNSELPTPSSPVYVSHGREVWHRNPRSRQPPVSHWQTMYKRLRDGPRTYALWRCCRWYGEAYPEFFGRNGNY